MFKSNTEQPNLYVSPNAKLTYIQQNRSARFGIALSRVFISFEAFCLTLIKKDRQNGEHRKGRVFLEGAKLAENQWA